MQATIDSVLYQAAALTFEELSFAFTSSELDETQRTAQPQAFVSISFSGPVSGTLVMVACGGILETLAANMLGKQEPPTPGEQRDALGEVANVICGNLLPGLAGPRAVFHLTAPQHAGAGNPVVAERASAAASVSIGVDEGRADLTLYLPSSWMPGTEQV